jgi:2Fe-2S ferredoxin
LGGACGRIIRGGTAQFIRPAEVPRVTYLSAEGTASTVEVPAGDTVLDGALDNGIAGLIGQCGGGCTCATCHCRVDPAWIDRVNAPHPDESELLEYVLERGPTSRLACQIEVTDALDGLTVELPLRQL